MVKNAEAMSDTTFLERPVYGFAEVDALLRIRPGTARRWIDGYDRGGNHYDPVVRAYTTGQQTVTWGEFRRDTPTRTVPGRSCADAAHAPCCRTTARQATAHTRSRVRKGVRARPRARRAPVQDEVGLPKGLAIVEELRTGQLTLTPPARAFFATSEFDDVRVHPDDALLGADERALSAELAGDIDPHAVVKRLAPLGRANAVRFDPDFSFGEPTVLGRNLRTDVLAEAVRAGDSVAAVAHAWSLSIHAVEQAVGWEEARTARAARRVCGSRRVAVLH